jgi:hypothetical protein
MSLLGTRKEYCELIIIGIIYCGNGLGFISRLTTPNRLVSFITQYEISTDVNETELMPIKVSDI